MKKRTIVIELETGSKEKYNNLANVIWLLMRSSGVRGRVVADNKVTNDELNNLWNELLGGEEWAHDEEKVS